MLQFSMGVIPRDKIRNDYIRDAAHVRCFADNVREARLRWFGHVLRRGSEYIDRRRLRMELAGGTPRGRARQRFIDVVKDDMKLAGAKAENAEDWVRWRQLICSSDT